MNELQAYVHAAAQQAIVRGKLGDEKVQALARARVDTFHTQMAKVSADRHFASVGAAPAAAPAAAAAAAAAPASALTRMRSDATEFATRKQRLQDKIDAMRESIRKAASDLAKACLEYAKCRSAGLPREMIEAYNGAVWQLLRALLEATPDTPWAPGQYWERFLSDRGGGYFICMSVWKYRFRPEAEAHFLSALTITLTGAVDMFARASPSRRPRTWADPVSTFAAMPAPAPAPASPVRPPAALSLVNSPPVAIDVAPVVVIPTPVLTPCPLSTPLVPTPVPSPCSLPTPILQSPVWTPRPAAGAAAAAAAAADVSVADAPMSTIDVDTPVPPISAAAAAPAPAPVVVPPFLEAVHVKIREYAARLATSWSSRHSAQAPAAAAAARMTDDSMSVEVYACAYKVIKLLVPRMERNFGAFLRKAKWGETVCNAVNKVAPEDVSRCFEQFLTACADAMYHAANKSGAYTTYVMDGRTLLVPKLMVPIYAQIPTCAHGLVKTWYAYRTVSDSKLSLEEPVSLVPCNDDDYDPLLCSTLLPEVSPSFAAMAKTVDDDSGTLLCSALFDDIPLATITVTPADDVLKHVETLAISLSPTMTRRYIELLVRDGWANKVCGDFAIQECTSPDNTHRYFCQVLQVCLDGFYDDIHDPNMRVA